MFVWSMSLSFDRRSSPRPVTIVVCLAGFVAAAGCGSLFPRPALSYHFLNRLREAVASYLRAIRLEPTDWKSNMNLGLAYSALGDHNAAVEHAQRAVNLNPTSAVAYANLGVTLDARGNRAEAEAAYRKALDLDPSQSTAAQNLVANLLDQKRPQAAIDLITPLLANS